MILQRSNMKIYFLKPLALFSLFVFSSLFFLSHSSANLNIQSTYCEESFSTKKDFSQAMGTAAVLGDLNRLDIFKQKASPEDIFFASRLAIQQGDTPTVKLFKNNLSDLELKTIIREAIHYQQVEVLNMLFKGRLNQNITSDPNIALPLATYKGHFTKLKKILEQNLDPNALNPSSIGMAFILAIHQGHLQAIKMLKPYLGSSTLSSLIVIFKTAIKSNHQTLLEDFKTELNTELSDNIFNSLLNNPAKAEISFFIENQLISQTTINKALPKLAQLKWTNLLELVVKKGLFKEQDINLKIEELTNTGELSVFEQKGYVQLLEFILNNNLFSQQSIDQAFVEFAVAKDLAGLKLISSKGLDNHASRSVALPLLIETLIKNKLRINEELFIFIEYMLNKGILQTAKDEALELSHQTVIAIQNLLYPNTSQTANKNEALDISLSTAWVTQNILNQTTFTTKPEPNVPDNSYLIQMQNDFKQLSDLLENHGASLMYAETALIIANGFTSLEDILTQKDFISQNETLNLNETLFNTFNNKTVPKKITKQELTQQDIIDIVKQGDEIVIEAIIKREAFKNQQSTRDEWLTVAIQNKQWGVVKVLSQNGFNIFSPKARTLALEGLAINNQAELLKNLIQTKFKLDAIYKALVLAANRGAITSLDVLIKNIRNWFNSIKKSNPERLNYHKQMIAVLQYANAQAYQNKHDHVVKLIASYIVALNKQKNQQQSNRSRNRNR